MSIFINIIVIKSDGIASEKKYANGVCLGKSRLLKQFISDYSDTLYTIAWKLNKNDYQDEYWSYKTNTGFIIRVNDSVSETYIWLFEIAKRKSCYFQGKSGATFRTYIVAVLNSDFTFKDWLKWKTKITSYVPKDIQKLGSEYEKIYKLLHQGKSSEDISKKLNLENNQFIEYFSKIESTLSKNNQLDLIHKPLLQSIDEPNSDNNSTSIELEDHSNLNSLDGYIVKEFKAFIEDIISKLNKFDRRVIQLYWGVGQDVQSIYDAFDKLGEANILIKENINSPQDIYSSISGIISKCEDIGNQLSIDKMKEYQIDTIKLKLIIKRYLVDWFEGASNE